MERKLGLFGCLFCSLIAVWNFFIMAVLWAQPLITVISDMTFWGIALSAVGFGISVRKNLRILQPLIFIVNAPLVLFVTDKVDTLDGMTPYLVLFSLGVILLVRYEYLKKHFTVKVLLLIICLYIPMYIRFAILSDQLTSFFSHAFLFAAYILMLLFIFKDKLIVYMAPPKPVLCLSEKKLTEREKQVTLSLLSGKTPKEIAFDLKLKDVTVRRYISSSFKKLGLRNQGELLSMNEKYTIEE